VKSLPWQVRDFHVVGGGCFGSHYVEALLKARSLGQLEFQRLLVIDQDSACALARSALIKDSQVSLIKQDWEAYLAKFLEANSDSPEAMSDHWVPSPLSPHLLFLAFIRAVGANNHSSQGNFEILDFAKNFKEGGPEASLPPPVKIPLKSGALALSFAQWKCPVHCIEPSFCPKLEATRDWDMEEALVASLKEKGVSLHVLATRHRLQGVGTIAMDRILAEFRSFKENLENLSCSVFKLATVSGCHGILGGARILR